MPTAGGKSLFYQVVASYVKHITLCITPILALGLDQMQKVLEAPDLKITTFYLDEMNNTNLNKMKQMLESIRDDITVFFLRCLSL